MHGSLITYVTRAPFLASAASSQPRTRPTTQTSWSTFAALGFQPTVTVREDDRLTVRLRNCPYRTAVHENQPAVCALQKAGCEIELQGIQPLTVDLVVKS